MTVLETAQAQELINYAKEIGREELPTLVSNSIAEIRKTFANAITTDIERPLREQITALVKACEENEIEIQPKQEEQAATLPGFEEENSLSKNEVPLV